MSEQSIYRIADIARQFGISRSTIYREIRRNRFPKPICLTSKIRGWRAEDLDQWYQGLLHPSKQLPLPFDWKERP